MIVWTDAQLSPHLAVWLRKHSGLEVYSVQYLGLRDATDRAIFEAARKVNAVVMTKDADFIELVYRYGPPPQVLWVTCGNTSMAFLKRRLALAWEEAIAMLSRGEPVVEISSGRDSG